MNDDVMQLKQQIRQRALACRRTLRRSEKQMLDFKLADRVLSLWKFRESPCLLVYCSKPTEVDTRRLIERAWSLGKTVALPRCRPDTVDLDFLVVCSWNDVAPGTLSILEPKEHCQPVPTDTASVCIVPGLAFDRSGNRIGYGKGYYDRFLTSYRGTTIGLIYDCCLEDDVPHERYDRKVDIVVTEKDTYFCKN